MKVDIKEQKEFNLFEEKNDIVITNNLLNSIVKELNNLFDGKIEELSTEPFTTIFTLGKLISKKIHIVNFKDLEISFGPIMKLHSRETDMLVLQEDRISYVLAGKNLLSDATGGGAVTSIPEVLGTQIALFLLWERFTLRRIG